jgi:hypothetical protein
VESPGENFAHVLVIDGANGRPDITHNDVRVSPRSMRINDRPAWVTPLNNNTIPSAEVIAVRLRQFGLD